MQKLKVGNVYRFTSSSQQYKELQIYHIENDLSRKRGFSYRSSNEKALSSGETFVVIDFSRLGDPLVVTSRHSVGHIYHSHLQWTGVKFSLVEIDENETKA